MDEYKNIYSNNDLTVTYEPCLCIHAERCVKELSEVFRLSIIPWIDLDATESKKIINQIKRCPSGALKYRLNKKKQAC